MSKWVLLRQISQETAKKRNVVHLLGALSLATLAMLILADVIGLDTPVQRITGAASILTDTFHQRPSGPHQPPSVRVQEGVTKQPPPAQHTHHVRSTVAKNPP
jgi:hypothetical protein